ncbi:MAG: glutathione S-transferase family protein [Pseudomonadota bacterium]
MASLRHYRLCPKSRAVRILCAEAGLIVELVDDQPWTWPPERTQLNPTGELPVLVTDEGAVAGVYPIVEWIADAILGEAAGTRDDTRAAHAIAGSAAERAEIRRLIDWFTRKLPQDATDWLLEEKVYARFRDGSEAGRAPDPETLRAALDNMDHHMRYLDHLAASRRWLAGDYLSAADICAAAGISTADYLGAVDWPLFPAAHAWYARMKSRPSVRRILEDRVPGAPPPPAAYDDPDF